MKTNLCQTARTSENVKLDVTQRWPRCEGLWNGRETCITHPFHCETLVSLKLIAFPASNVLKIDKLPFRCRDCIDGATWAAWLTLALPCTVYLTYAGWLYRVATMHQRTLRGNSHTRTLTHIRKAYMLPNGKRSRSDLFTFSRYDIKIYLPRAPWVRKDDKLPSKPKIHTCPHRQCKPGFTCAARTRHPCILH